MRPEVVVQDVTGAMSLRQNVVGQEVGHGQWGRKSLRQNLWGRWSWGKSQKVLGQEVGHR